MLTSNAAVAIDLDALEAALLKREMKRVAPSIPGQSRNQLCWCYACFVEAERFLGREACSREG
jgi:hypothetical protein